MENVKLEERDRHNESEELLYAIFTHIWGTKRRLGQNGEVIVNAKESFVDITENQYYTGTYYILTDAVSLYCSMHLHQGIPLGEGVPQGIAHFLKTVPQNKYKAEDKKQFLRELRKQYKNSVKENKRVYGEERNGLEHYVCQFNRKEFLWQPATLCGTTYGFNVARIYTMLQIITNVTDVGYVYVNKTPVLCIKDSVNYVIYYLLPAKMGASKC